MTQEEEAMLRERLQDLNRSLAAISYRRTTIQIELQICSREYLSQFKEKESIERQLTKVKVLPAKKEPPSRAKRLTKIEKMLKNMTPANVVELLTKMKGVY